MVAAGASLTGPIGRILDTKSFKLRENIAMFSLCEEKGRVIPDQGKSEYHRENNTDNLKHPWLPKLLPLGKGDREPRAHDTTACREGVVKGRAERVLSVNVRIPLLRLASSGLQFERTLHIEL